MFAVPSIDGANVWAKKHDGRAFSASPTEYETEQFFVLAMAFAILHKTS
jgi:hypothetical protein